MSTSTVGEKKSTSWLPLKLAGVSLITALLGLSQSACSAEKAVAIAPPALDEPVGTAHREVAVIAGGCFWGVQGVFQHVRGVENAVSGYAGGAANTAEYGQVSSGDTGHAESVQITYDPTTITYGRLLQVFFSVAHNPTELNRQGPDSGTQYRSAIFPQNPLQEKIAKAYIAQLDTSKAFNAPIVTRIENNKAFYPAETYHQNYLTLNPSSPYIVINDLPKVEYLKQMEPTLYRADPVLVGITK